MPLAEGTTLTELEEQLRISFDRSTIAVYGDQLQAIGDPRGELIAMDLAIDDSGLTPRLAIQRAALIDVWLGALPLHESAQLRYGFVELDATGADPVSQVRTVFDGRAASFVRSVTMCGPPKLLGRALAIVAAAPRPSLVRLVIRQWAEGEAPAVSDDAKQAADDKKADVARLISAMPHLRSLEVDGRNVLAGFSHPNVRRMRISGFDAIRTLADGKLALAELTELDLALYAHHAGTQGMPSPSLFATFGTMMPKLVDLDLSRNAPGFTDPDTLGGITNIFSLVLALDIRTQLRTLRLPATGSPKEMAAIRELFPGATVST